MLLAILGVLPVAAGVIWSSPFAGLGFARAGEQAWGPRQGMTHVHACVCFCAATSAFTAAPVAKPRVTEFWLCSLFFPSLMSPVSCLSLTPLCEPGVTLPLCPQLPAFSGVCCYPPHLREECVLSNLYFSLACAICNLDFACIKWSLIVPQGCSSLSAFPKNLFPVEAETLNIFPTAQSSPALPAPCTALDAPP